MVYFLDCIINNVDSPPREKNWKIRYIFRWIFNGGSNRQGHKKYQRPNQKIQKGTLDQLVIRNKNDYHNSSEKLQKQDISKLQCLMLVSD